VKENVLFGFEKVDYRVLAHDRFLQRQRIVVKKRMRKG
jgi:hypothetical protein